MNWSTSVVSSISSDTEPTIVVAFDNAKYLFNVGENTTRTFLQTKKAWRKTRALFLSQICTDRTAGLPGFLMTIADSGVKDLTITGPDGLDHFISSTRLYTRREELSVCTVELPCVTTANNLADVTQENPTPVYKDENITVFGIQAIPQSIKPARSTMLKRKHSSEEHTRRRNRANSSSSSRCDSSQSPVSERHSTESMPTLDKPSTTHQLSLAHVNVHRVLDPNSSLPSATSSSSQPQELNTPQQQEQPLPLLERMHHPTFTPHHLNSAEAVEWRKMTIEHMFGPLVRGRYESVEAEVGSGVANPNANGAGRPKRIPNPANCDKKLPAWRSGLRDRQRTACSYILIGPKIRGKFDVAKAAKLGLGPGPLRGKVARGETVEVKIKLPDGSEEVRKVGPQDCLGAAEKPVVVCVVDCPTPAHIPSLTSSPTWEPYYSKEAGEEVPHNVNVVYHLIGTGVVEDELYKAWMARFGPNVHHLVANRKYCPNYMTFTSVAMSQLRLWNLDREMFPLLQFNGEADAKLDSVPNLPPNTQPLHTMHHISMRPLKAPEILPAGYDKFHAAAKLTPEESLSTGMRTKFEEARKTIEGVEKENGGGEGENMVGKDVVVIPLGTSSSTPSKYRNVSSILVETPQGSILLDCGEGTYGQLTRYLGEKTEDALRRLRCIFVSHIHADHHIGLARVLAMRRKLDPKPTEPLYLVAFRSIHLYLQEYSELEDIGLTDPSGGVVRILSDVTHWKRKPYEGTLKPAFVDAGLPSAQNSEVALQTLREILGLESFQGVDVAHRTRCFGLVMRHKSGWSLVYSADTMPCQNLVDAGKDATLLIHEATMSDEQADLAEKKAHSTFGQAIDIAKQMQARNVLLTHFSARHPKMPPGISSLENLHVGIAFDYLRVPLNSVWKLAMYQDAIEESFADMRDEDEDVVVGGDS